MSWTAERARVASLSRSRSADDPELIAARQRLKLERLKVVVTRALAAAEPVTKAQRVDLAAFILGGDA